MATILNKPKLEEKQKVATEKPTFGGAQAAPVPAATPATQGQQATPAKSGGFTNLSSYLQANKQAGTKIAGKIGEGVEKDVTKKKEGATTEADQFKQAVEASKGNVAQGQQFLQQITPQQAAAQAQTQPGPVNVIDTTSITSDPNLLNQFTGLRTGETQAAAQAAQQKEQQEAINAAQTLADTYGTRMQQIGSSDRYGLLREFLANPKTQYGRGLSSLDNALLQRDKTKALEGVKKGLQKEATTETKARTEGLAALGAEGEAAVKSGQQLAKDIQTQADKNIADYNKAFQEAAGSVNAERAAEQEWAKQQYKNLQEGKAIDQRFADMLGLTQGQRVGDILARGNISDYLGFGATDLSTGLQAATPEQLARMQSIYQLAGQSFTAPQQAEAALLQQNQFAGADQRLNQMYSELIDAANRGEYNIGGSATNNTAAQLATGMRDLLSNQAEAQKMYDLLSRHQSGQIKHGTPEYQQLLQYQRVLSDAAKINPNTDTWAQEQMFMRMLDNLSKQGYYNTVAIRDPSDTRSMDDILNLGRNRG